MTQPGTTQPGAMREILSADELVSLTDDPIVPWAAQGPPARRLYERLGLRHRSVAAAAFA